MGSSQSNNKNKNSPTTKSEESKSLQTENHTTEIIHDKNIGSEGEQQRENQNHSSIGKSNSIRDDKQVQRLDFSVFENEDPIQRRRRIMSGDRRYSYVMKLQSFRQAQEKKLSDKKKSNKINSIRQLIHPEALKGNLDIINSEVKDLDICNVNTENTIKSNISVVNTDNKDDDKKILPVTVTVVPESYNEDVENNVQETNLGSNKDSENSVTATVLSNCNNSHKTVNQVKCPSLPSRLDKNFYYDLAPSNTENIAKSRNNSRNPDIIEHPENHERKLEPFKSTQETVENSKKDEHKSLNSIKLPETPIKNENKKQKSIFNLFSQRFKTVEKSSNSGLKGSSRNSDGPLGIISGYDSIITFESDYSVNGFDSDDLNSDSSTETIKRFKNKKLSTSTIDTCPSSSFTTLISYEKVKKLFKKRIAEIEIEESANSSCISKNNHYKELEELGRGHWKNGVWVPSGRLTESIRHKICRENYK